MKFVALCSIICSAAVMLATTPVTARPMTVVEARGTPFKPGMRVDSETPVQLREGEKLTLIAQDGRAATLRGPYRGKAGGNVTAGATRPGMALSALVATRRDRSTAVGAVRSGADAAPLPAPWLIDIGRPGLRCLREGDAAVWWRADSAREESFTVAPLDKSWRATLTWSPGQSEMPAPDIMSGQMVRTFLVRAGDRDNAITVNIIPAGVDEPLVVASWMIEKNCVQQADAYLRELERTLPANDVAQTDSAPLASMDSDNANDQTPYVDQIQTDGARP